MSEIGDDDKRQFFEDGFLIVRNAVSSELVARAKALIQEAIRRMKDICWYQAN